ncbi:MAG: PilT/PilU family type 4a pilus ATPase [Candidatus Eremiobacterota bacterium]
MPEEVRALSSPTLVELVTEMVKLNGSDLHISALQPPIVRVQGVLHKLPIEPLDPDVTASMIMSALNQSQLKELGSKQSVDLILELDTELGSHRLRTNVFVQSHGVDAVLRLIPEKPPDMETLGLPKGLEDLVFYRQGIVLVTGPSGCGKSTTLAALIHHLNKHRCRHVVTLEDPIEYIHTPIKSIVTQRQVGVHTESFLGGLRSALREAPDVILVGELRDLETFSLAMTAAETGHLVLATLHTSNCASTIERVIGSFPAGQQGLVRVMLSDSLRGIVSQYLLPRADHQAGRVVACEVMYCTPAISNLIRESRTYQIPGTIETSRTLGMQLMDNSLMDLLQQGQISARTAYTKANSKSRFEDFLEWTA